MAQTVLYLHNPTPQVLIEDQFIQSIGGEPEIGADDDVLTLRNSDDDITVISGDLPELLSQIIDACATKGIKAAARTMIDDGQRSVLLETTSRWLEHLDETVIPALEDPEDIKAYTAHRHEVEAVSAQLSPITQRIASTAIPTEHLEALVQAAEKHAETLAQLVLETETDEPEANTSYRDQQQALEAALDHLRTRRTR